MRRINAVIGVACLFISLVLFQNCSPDPVSTRTASSETVQQITPPYSEIGNDIKWGEVELSAFKFPAAIVCEASQGRYEILYYRISGGLGNIAYANQDSFVRFTADGIVETAMGSTAALLESNCQLGADILSIKKFEIQTGAVPLFKADFPDALGCQSESSGMVELVYHRIKGNEGHVAYTNHEALLRFNSSGNVITVPNPATAAMMDSPCGSTGNHISSIVHINFNAGSTNIIEGWPDAIICQASGGRYEILYNRVRGNGGNVAYANDDAFMQFSSSGAKTSQDLVTSAYTDSDCASASNISQVQGFSFAKIFF